MRVQRQSKHEYMARMQVRYVKATKREKGKLLDEVVAVTGYHRRHAARVLRHGRFPDPTLAAVQGQPVAPSRRGGVRGGGVPQPRHPGSPGADALRGAPPRGDPGPPAAADGGAGGGYGGGGGGRCR